MKNTIKSIALLIIAMMLSCVIFSSKSHAVSISLELSGDGIYWNAGKYFVQRKLPVGEKLNVKAENVIKNDMWTVDTPIGETSREDKTSECTWVSSNEGVAKVTNGVIEGISEGTAEIKVTYPAESSEATLVISIGDDIILQGSITITQKDNIKTIKKGNTLQLDIKGIESLTNITNKDVTWSSEDKKIATVDENGLVTSVGVGKTKIKASLNSYSSEYEIEVTEDKQPNPDTDNYYDISIDKEKIDLKIGESGKIEIKATYKPNYSTIQIVKMAKDNWDVEWKIEDESIAKCVPETGIENNIYGLTQIPGRATIQGLKAGKTNLLIKVKVADNKFEEFNVPITVTGEQEDEKKAPDDEKKTPDDSVADKELAKTGDKNIFISLGVGFLAIAAVYFRKKSKK